MRDSAPSAGAKGRRRDPDPCVVMNVDWAFPEGASLAGSGKKRQGAHTVIDMAQNGHY
jgi:hypothetical protein